MVLEPADAGEELQTQRQESSNEETGAEGKRNYGLLQTKRVERKRGELARLGIPWEGIEGPTIQSKKRRFKAFMKRKRGS